MKLKHSCLQPLISEKLLSFPILPEQFGATLRVSMRDALAQFVEALSYKPEGTGSFPGGKSSRGVTLTPHPLPVPWSRKSRATPLLPVWVVRPVQSLSACTRVHLPLWDPIR